jgi:hypothetical protein
MTRPGDRFLSALTDEPWADHVPADEVPVDDYVAAIHKTVWDLVAMDVKFGGNEASRHAVRALSAVRQRLPGDTGARRTRDLYAAVAELAELTGWLLIDANRHDAARRANRLSMTLARICGDRSMELFVTHNMSLQATYLRQPQYAFDIIRPVLDRRHLTSRLNAMLRLRAARAHAQMGLPSEAFRLLDHARSLLFDGVSDRDPAWSWWISPRGFDFATAAMHGTLGHWKAAIQPLYRALEATPTSATRDRFLYLCALLHAHIEISAWRDATSTANDLAPLIGTVGSDRPLARLAATIERVDKLQIPAAPRLRLAIEPVQETMRDSGWAPPSLPAR